MAFNQWPDSIAAIISTGAPYTIDLGNVTPDENQQLEIYRIQVFKKGSLPLARMRINAYVAGDLVATSEDVIVGTIEDLYPDTPQFYGWVNFTFSPRLNLNASAPTRFEMELANYTYTDDSAFIAAIKDWPTTMGFNSTVGSPGSAPFALELYGAE